MSVPLGQYFVRVNSIFFYSCVRIDETINYIFCFRVETIDGSAVEGEDYEPVNEILTFEPREREKEV